jgi:hypothetical protein
MHVALSLDMHFLRKNLPHICAYPHILRHDSYTNIILQVVVYLEHVAL